MTPARANEAILTTEDVFDQLGNALVISSIKKDRKRGWLAQVSGPIGGGEVELASLSAREEVN
jgi:hypothetical protein